MTDVYATKIVQATDLGDTQFNLDDTFNGSIASTTYITGSPEVGVTFIAPFSGKVRVTIGSGFRDEGASVDRVFLSLQMFEDDANGTEVIAPSVTTFGHGSCDVNTEFQYGCRVGMIEDLTPGQQYYARVQHLATPGTDPDSADVTGRSLIIIPVP